MISRTKSEVFHCFVLCSDVVVGMWRATVSNMCDESRNAVASTNVANEFTTVVRKQQQYGLSVADAATTALMSGSFAS